MRDEVPRPISEQHAESAAREPEDEPFGQQLARQARTTGPERESQTQLAATRGGPAEEQARDVGARDEQDDPDQREQRDERPAEILREIVEASRAVQQTEGRQR